MYILNVDDFRWLVSVT